MSAASVRFRSTRAEAPSVGLADALRRGLAEDGGLYVPEAFPSVGPADFGAAESLPAVAATLLAPFFRGDVLEAELSAITAEAFDFPVPLKALPAEHDLSVLELFHGPTAAFKDFGARFLAASLARLKPSIDRPLTILVATSGDTGGAVAGAFHGRPGTRVVVLFPKGRVSPRQEAQLTCWDGNVQALSVEGSFDDCQRLVKAAFTNDALKRRFELSSANSINLGRLLPQAAYYAQSSLAVFRRTGKPANYVIPSGNLGNALACIWARTVGLPIGHVHLAHNRNRTVPDYFAAGDWQPRASVATIASAMDVGNPSNMERLRDLVPNLNELKRFVSVDWVDDPVIAERIQTDYRRFGEVWCPHTAVGAEAYERLPAEVRAAGPWVLVGTAHPAKFPETVEPLLGLTLPIPPALEALLALPRRFRVIEPAEAALTQALL